MKETKERKTIRSNELETSNALSCIHSIAVGYIHCSCQQLKNVLISIIMSRELRKEVNLTNYVIKVQSNSK